MFDTEFPIRYLTFVGWKMWSEAPGNKGASVLRARVLDQTNVFLR